MHDLEFQSVAVGAEVSAETGFALTGDQVELVGSVAVKGRIVRGLFHRVDAAKPVGGRAQAVAGVVQQGVLRDEASLRAVELHRIPKLLIQMF